MIGAWATCASGLGALGWHKAHANTHHKPLKAQDIKITAQKFNSFQPSHPEKTRFGSLNMRSGLSLKSDHEAFGGFSGLSRSLKGGRDLLSINDRGWWLKASVERNADDGLMTGLSHALISPMLSQNGKPLAQTRAYDTEGLYVHEDMAYVSVERTHNVFTFDLAKKGLSARALTLLVPPETRRLAANRSLEAIGRAPENSPLKGALVVIAERSSGERDKESKPTKGWILSGPLKGAFEVARHKGYDITDLTFLPNGDMLLLERHYSLFRGVGMRIRCVRALNIRPNTQLEGDYVLTCEGGYNIDNMEGMSLHHDSQGRIILTFISDDNFSIFKSTLIWEAEWMG